MKDKKNAKTMERRGFFKMVGIGAVAGAATLATGPADGEAATGAKASEGTGYRETELVKKYYDLASF